jgi:hypothetical protein
MSDELREAVARALYDVEGHKFGWDTQPDNDIREWHRGQADAALTAAQAEVARLQDGDWSYDFGPRKVPNGLIEVAFDAGLGDFYVRICEQKITRNMATYDRPLPVEEYEYGYFDEYGKDASSGRRPYAWRKITVPLSREARAALVQP